MTACSTPQTPRTILSFDFDGTLHNPATDPPVTPELFDLLRHLEKEHNALWGINTGRALPHMIEGLAESHFPSPPHFIVAREREIFFPAADGTWQEDTEWNEQCARSISHLLDDMRETISQIRHLVQEHTGAEWIEQPGEPAGIIARTEEEMGWLHSRIVAMVPPGSALGWQRNSIYLRFGHRDFQKGSSLARVARHFRLTPEQVFAIGDSHNDLEMLHPGIASMIACPANAVPEISAHVREKGGYHCQQSYSAAAVEALRHFFHLP